MNIVEVTEYQNMDYHCSDDSYYECLLKRLLRENSGYKGNKKLNGPFGQYNATCLPFSLPINEKDNISICEDNLQRAFFEDMILQLEMDQHQHCKK